MSQPNDSGEIPRSFGREAFGTDPAGYDAIRPPYPDWVFDELTMRGALWSGARTFEIGPGTGIATRALRARGAGPITAIEPDPRLASYLRERCPDVEVREETFESCRLDHAAFDLGFCATAFHWLDESSALARIADALKPGAWWAMVWHVFGDDRPDRFHEATIDLLAGPSSPSSHAGGPPFPLDATARIAALEQSAAFDDIAHRRRRWTLALTPDEVADLYRTYSTIAARPDRADVLAALRQIAVEQFAGRVTRNMTTSLYVARRTKA